MDPIERNPRLGWSRSLGFFASWRRSRVIGLSGGNADRSKKTKKEITKHQREFLRLRETSLYLAEAECNARRCGAIGRRCRSFRPSSWYSGLLWSRPGEHGERGGIKRGAAESQGCAHV